MLQEDFFNILLVDIRIKTHLSVCPQIHGDFTKGMKARNCYIVRQNFDKIRFTTCEL